MTAPPFTNMTTFHYLYAIVLGLLFLGISQGSFSQNRSDRSVSQGSQPVMVAFANQTPDPVTALWIDFDGMAQEVGMIPPGQIVELATFPGHLTVFSSRGRQLSSFRASVPSHGSAFGIVGPGGSTDPSRPRIISCTRPPVMNNSTNGNVGTPGGPSAPPPGATMNDLRGIIQSLLTGAPLDPTVPVTSTPANQRKYTGVYRGKQSTFNLTWERADGTGNVDGMMIIEGDMASSFSGGESRPGFLEVSVSADSMQVNHKLNKVVQGGKISWVGEYITLIETK